MPIQFHAQQTKDFVLKRDRDAAGGPKPGSPVFRIGAIPDWQIPGLIQRAAKAAESDDPADDGRVRRMVIRAGLKGWEGVCGPDGAVIDFKGDAAGAPTDATLDVLGNDWIAIYDLSESIMLHNFLTEKTLGN